MESFSDKDDVLTLLVHLGYLAYSPDKKEVYIPNEEIKTEFQAAIKSTGWDTVVKVVGAAGGAIRQIKEKQYISALGDYKGNLVLAGINYDKKTKKHECKIEKYVYGKDNT